MCQTSHHLCCSGCVMPRARGVYVLEFEGPGDKIPMALGMLQAQPLSPMAIAALPNNP